MAEHEKKYKLLFSNTVIFAISNLLSKIILSLLLPLYTRELTTAEYGTAEMVTTISQLIVPVCSVTIQDAVFRFSMDSSKKPEAVLKQSFLVMGIATFMLAATSLALRSYDAVSLWYKQFFLISVFTMIRSVFSLYTKAVNQTGVFALDNLLYNLVLACCNLALLLKAHMGLSGYFLAMILANAESILFLAIKNRSIRVSIKCRISRDLLKEMICYSAPLILNSISWGLTHVVDRVMLTEYSSAAATGIYSVASKIPSLLSLVTGVFTQAWVISMIRDYESEKDIHFYENIFALTHISVVLLSVLILSVTNTLFVLVLGTDFETAARYVPVLLIGAVFLTYSNYYSSFYAAMKKSWHLMFSSLGGGLMNVILNSVLIPISGIMGACVATTVSYIFIAIFRMIDCKRLCKIEIKPVALTISVSLLSLLSVLVTIKWHEMISSAITAIIIVFLYRRSIMQFILKAWKLIIK